MLKTPDRTEEKTQARTDKAGLKDAAAEGLFAYLIRQVVTKFIGLFANIFLARHLDSADYGVYAIVFFWSNIIKAIADGGLGASLVQQDLEPSKNEKDLVCTTQLFLFGIPTLILVFAAPFICSAYALPKSDELMIRLVALGAFMSIFATVSRAQVSRQLRFNDTALILTIELVTFQIGAVLMAMIGMKAWSFVIALIVSETASLAVSQFLSPYLPAIYFNFAELKSRLRYGLAYQSSGFLSLIRDSLNPVFIGLLSGSSTVGLVSFATTFAFYPVQIASQMAYLLFPLFSRAKSDTDNLSVMLGLSLRWCCLFIFGVVSVLTPAAPLLIPVIFGIKWIPALPLILILFSATVCQAISIPLINVANALGQSGKVLRLQVANTILCWLIGVPLIEILGIRGYGIGFVLSQAAHVYFFFSMRKEVQINCWPTVVRLGIASMGTIASSTVIFACVGGVGLSGCIKLLCISAALFSVWSRLMVGPQLTEDLIEAYQMLKSKLLGSYKASART